MSFDPPTYEKMATDPQSRVLGWRFTDFDVLFPYDDVAIATYRAWQKFTHKGETVEQDVVDSSTWVRIDGQWKCAALPRLSAAAWPFSTLTSNSATLPPWEARCCATAWPRPDAPPVTTALT